MNLKQLISTWLGDVWSRWMIIIIFVLNLTGWTAIWYLAPRDLDVSPLHYTIYFGINLTGRWMELFWLPAIGLVALLTHLLIARLIHHAMWRRVWLVLALVINLMMVTDVTAMLLLLRSASF